MVDTWDPIVLEKLNIFRKLMLIPISKLYSFFKSGIVYIRLESVPIMIPYFVIESALANEECHQNDFYFTLSKYSLSKVVKSEEVSTSSWVPQSGSKTIKRIRKNEEKKLLF